MNERHSKGRTRTGSTQISLERGPCFLIGLFVSARDVRVPGHTGFRFKIDCLARDGWDDDEVVAFGTLNLPSGVLLIALQVLGAMRAGKFKFAHNIGGYRMI
jgi:hypothetical protein